MNYFISDLHIGHVNMLSYDNRSFKDIETHDAIIMHNWNEAVGYDDDVYILGDISWLSPQKTIEYLRKLNGNKHLIIGNHDGKLLKNREFRNEFVEICNYKELDIGGGKSIVLCHYSMPCFKNHYYGWYHLYGHVHNSFEWHMMERVKYEMEELYDKPCQMFNCGCMMDYMNYTPRTLEHIVENGGK